MNILFTVEKETKGTFKFAEVVDEPLGEEKIGSLYVRKGTLREIGWEPGQHLSVTIVTVETDGGTV